MVKIMNKKRENLEAINNWCKSLGLNNEIIYIDNALYCNNRYYRLSISKNVIGANGNGKYSRWLHVDDTSDSLITSRVGSEIIYNWTDIKQRILNAVDDYKRKQNIMQNFVV